MSLSDSGFYTILSPCEESFSGQCRSGDSSEEGCHSVRSEESESPAALPVSGSFELALNPGHPIFRAHFPGRPITPGVVLVQIAVELAGLLLGRPLQLSGISSVKFLAPVIPGPRPDGAGGDSDASAVPGRSFASPAAGSAGFAPAGTGLSSASAAAGSSGFAPAGTESFSASPAASVGPVIFDLKIEKNPGGNLPSGETHGQQQAIDLVVVVRDHSRTFSRMALTCTPRRHSE